MFDAIPRLLQALLRLLFPATGRHRAPSPAAPDASTRRLPRRVRRLQRRRRWALWLASVGVDNGPRRIHGVRVVTAR